MLNVPNTEVYTDFNGLAKLKNEARQQSPQAIKEVARQFESVFLGMVMKSMREAKLADGILDSKQSDFYRDMYDQQMALHLSGEPGIGLAELIARQLSPKQFRPGEKMDAADYLNRSVAVSSRSIRQPGLLAKTVDDDAVVDRMVTVQNDSGRPVGRKHQFVQTLRPYAEQAALQLGVDANVLLAQAALETGWGKSVIKHSNGRSSFNLFNIKADSRWHGMQASQKTVEFRDGIGRQETAAFRAYDSYRDSFNDYVQFIQSNPRYGNALKMTAKPERYMHELQKAGYATDPAYAQKVMQIYLDAAIQQGELLAMQ